MHKTRKQKGGTPLTHADRVGVRVGRDPRTTHVKNTVNPVDKNVPLNALEMLDKTNIDADFKAIPAVLGEQTTLSTQTDPKMFMYSNILPYKNKSIVVDGRVIDATIITLPCDLSQVNTLVELQEYINKNQMTLDLHQLLSESPTLSYIAAGYPTPTAQYYFWKMIIDHSVSVICSVCDEKTKETNFEKYYPTDTTKWLSFNNSKSEHNIVVTHMGTTKINDRITQRVFVVATKEGTHNVTHLLHTRWLNGCEGTNNSYNSDNWQDCLSDTMDLSNLISQHANRSQSLPVIQCGSCTGNTGTMIALNYLMHILGFIEPNEITVSDQTIHKIYNIVVVIIIHMRLQHMLMVNRPSQFKFIINAIFNMLTNKKTYTYDTLMWPYNKSNIKMLAGVRENEETKVNYENIRGTLTNIQRLGERSKANNASYEEATHAMVGNEKRLGNIKSNTDETKKPNKVNPTQTNTYPIQSKQAWDGPIGESTTYIATARPEFCVDGDTLEQINSYMEAEDTSNQDETVPQIQLFTRLEKTALDSSGNPVKRFKQAEEVRERLYRYRNITPYIGSSTELGFKEIGAAKITINTPDNIELSYIASQGPLETTCHDFWTMVLFNNVHVICMVTNMVENGKQKCFQYFPESIESPVTFQIGKHGNSKTRNKETETEIYTQEITVKCTKVQKISSDGEVVIIMRTFDIFIVGENEQDKTGKKSKDKTTPTHVHTVTHLHYTIWPDHGVPAKLGTLVQLSNLISEYTNKAYDTTKNSIPLVHCSAGVGRTGTIIALNSLLHYSTHSPQNNIRHLSVNNTHNTNRSVHNPNKSDNDPNSCLDALCENVCDVITQMRTQRMDMVQTAAQYAAIVITLAATKNRDTLLWNQTNVPRTGAQGAQSTQKTLNNVTNSGNNETHCEIAYNFAPQNIDKGAEKKQILVLQQRDNSCYYLVKYKNGQLKAGPARIPTHSEGSNEPHEIYISGHGSEPVLHYGKNKFKLAYSSTHYDNKPDTRYYITGIKKSSRFFAQLERQNQMSSSQSQAGGTLKKQYKTKPRKNTTLKKKHK